jgi:phage tail-like protein
MTTMVLGKVTQGVLGGYPAYGMAMRFGVQVDDLSLGNWHSCKGLKVSFDYEVVKQGGDYLEATRLPNRLNYEPITLERAVLSAESKAVQAWLANYVRSWRIYPVSEQPPQTTKATISLLDYKLSEVMKWELDGVFPKSWSGPSLGADDNKVAMETLVLEHSGFLRV